MHLDQSCRQHSNVIPRIIVGANIVVSQTPKKKVFLIVRTIKKVLDVNTFVDFKHVVHVEYYV